MNKILVAVCGPESYNIVGLVDEEKVADIERVAAVWMTKCQEPYREVIMKDNSDLESDAYKYGRDFERYLADRHPELVFEPINTLEINEFYGVVERSVAGGKDNEPE